MAKLKYTPQLKRKYVQKYLSENWASQRQFSRANKLSPSLFSKWHAEFKDLLLSSQPVFSKLEIIDENKVVEPKQEIAIPENNIEIIFAWGKCFNLKFTIPSKYLNFGAEKNEKFSSL